MHTLLLYDISKRWRIKPNSNFETLNISQSSLAIHRFPLLALKQHWEPVLCTKSWWRTWGCRKLHVSYWPWRKHIQNDHVVSDTINATSDCRVWLSDGGLANPALLECGSVWRQFGGKQLSIDSTGRWSFWRDNTAKSCINHFLFDTI